MKRFYRLLLGILVVVSIAIPSVCYGTQGTVNLGAASTFAVLAGTTITNTGSTEIVGSAGRDVGAYPGIVSTKPEKGTVSESVSFSNTEAMVAQKDLVAAYTDAAGRTPVTRISTELGGKTLRPGVYDSASGNFELTGTLTLDAQGDPNGIFIFLTESSLVTAPNSMVDTVGGAQYSSVYWKVGSTAILGADSVFSGHILALSSIEAQNGATIQGQLLSRNGEVILSNNNIINQLSTTIHAANVSGDILPDMSNPWYTILMYGVGAAITGLGLWSYSRRYYYNKSNLV